MNKRISEFVKLSRTFLNCKFCGKQISKSNFIRHENSCSLNNKNIRSCPVCSKPILNKRFTTCSRGCSNTAYRSKLKESFDLQPKRSTYRDICFAVKKHECIVCGEKEVVDVHHLDQNHENNEIENLIVLCPTHHRYIHTKRLKHIVLEKITGCSSEEER